MAGAPITLEMRSYASGMNASVLPTAGLRSDELSLLINGTVRNGYLRTRPGWHFRPISFSSSEAQYHFETGRYQGSGFFMSNYGNVFIFAVDGHVFILDPKKNMLSKAVKHQPFSKFSPHVFIQQRNKWVIAQDGVSPPLVSDGIEATQEAVQGGVPTGTLMVDGWHRLSVVSPDRRRLYMSDHELDVNSTPISFTEGQYFGSARYFEAPPSLGRIMGVAYTPYQDSSTGIGPLLIFCERGTRAYNVGIPRTEWVQGDISQTILPNIGACSHFAFAAKGGQLMFRDQSGRIRSIRNAQQFEATDADSPNDYAISTILDTEDTTLRQYSQAVNFDNRVLVLTHPQRFYHADGRFSVIHQGIAVLENETVSDKPDVWAFWTGRNICGMVVGNVDGQEVLLALCRDSDGKNRIYELVSDSMVDVVPGKSSPVDQQILMTWAPPITDFQTPTSPKVFKSAGMRITGLRGDLEIKGKWEMDGKQPYDWFTHKESHPACMVFGQRDCGIGFTADGSNPALMLPAIGHNNRFYKGRPIFQIKGQAQVEESFITCEPLEPTTTSNVNCKGVDYGGQLQCGVDIFEYSDKPKV